MRGIPRSRRRGQERDRGLDIGVGRTMVAVVVEQDRRGHGARMGALPAPAVEREPRFQREKMPVGAV